MGRADTGDSLASLSGARPQRRSATAFAARVVRGLHVADRIPAVAFRWRMAQLRDLPKVLESGGLETNTLASRRSGSLFVSLSAVCELGRHGVHTMIIDFTSNTGSTRALGVIPRTPP